MSWAGDGQPTSYTEPAALVEMPAQPTGAVERTARQPRPKPGCDDCAMSESGVCGRHRRDPRTSVDGCQPKSHAERLESTWEPAGAGRL